MKLLAVCPQFAPNTSADGQRLRILAPHLHARGWEIRVIAAAPDTVFYPQDPLLLQSLGDTVRIDHYCPSQRGPLRHLGWRSRGPIRTLGETIIQEWQPDVALFTTTLFPVMTVARRWKARHGLPYLIDIQDMWWVDRDQQQHKSRQRPGGRLKYATDNWLSRWMEPTTLRDAAHVITVSPDYRRILLNRYPHLPPTAVTELGFGIPDSDLALIQQTPQPQPIFRAEDGKQHWVSVGRGGDDLLPAARQLFRGLDQLRQQQPDLPQRLAIHFVGTSYAERDRQQPSFSGLIEEFGLQALVSEHPARLPYFQALQLLEEADGLLMLGSTDSGYSASKAFSYALVQRPGLGLLLPHSPLEARFRELDLGQVVPLGSDGTDAAVMEGLNWLLHQPRHYPGKTEQRRQVSTARQAEQLHHWLQRAIADSGLPAIA